MSGFLLMLFAFIPATYGQDRKEALVSGKVTSTDHEIMDFATVQVKGTSTGTRPDEKGIYHLRVSPGIFFGNKVVKYRESNSQATQTQDLKSNYIVLPVELKFSAERCNNYRPYLIGGVMATADVSKKRNDFLKLNTFDGYLTIGIGCDLYLPYFKLIPELKFCYSLINSLDKKHPDQLRDDNMIMYAKSVNDTRSKMIVLSFYFE